MTMTWCHIELSKLQSAPPCHCQAEIEWVQIFLNCSQPGFPQSTGCASPDFGRTLNAVLNSSRMVLTGVGTIKSCQRKTCAINTQYLTAVAGPVLVMCKYSKFRIESNSYLLFDSIRNWRNYSKFSNTYLTVISRAIDMQFVCTLLASHKPLHSPDAEPSAAPLVFLHLPLPWPCTHAPMLSHACVRAPSARSRPWHLIAL